MDPSIIFPFPLDPFQIDACAAIQRKENVLVCAKTGSGKTLVAEYQIHACLSQSQRIFYTTPIKSLSNQKYHDLKTQFPQTRVGILTGDIKFCPDAQIVVMTTEILRNLLYKQDTATEHLGLTANLSMKNVGAIIFDECHYMNDPDRGHVWEECFILMPSSVQMVLLSATLESPEYLAEWLTQIKDKKCHLIQTNYRVVPLQHAVLFRNMSDTTFNSYRIEVLCDSKGNFIDKIYTNWLKSNSDFIQFRKSIKIENQLIQATKDKAAAIIHQQTERPESFQNRMNDALGFLHEREMLPALFFVLSRRSCEKYANQVTRDFLDGGQVASVKNTAMFHLSRYKATLEKMPQWTQLFPLLQRGIAYHHSGLIPIIKEIIELLFSRGLIKILFCTETFAVGLNMPTKTTIFAGFHKYDELKDQMRMLRTDEYLQMAGRAGRRGKDKEGWAIYLPERDPVPLTDIRKMMIGSCQAITSRMELGFELILKTLLSSGVSGRDPITILRKSYWSRLRIKQFEKNQAQILVLEDNIRRLGIDEPTEQELKERARLESEFRESTNADRKKAQAALETWKNRHQGRWDKLWKDWTQVKIWREHVAELHRENHELQNYSGLLKERLLWLESEGYLEKNSSSDDPLSPTPIPQLSLLGLAATEVNEACPLILPTFYLGNPEMRAEFVKNPTSLICLLSCFLETYWKGEDGIQPEPGTIIRDSNVPSIVKNGYIVLEKIAQRVQRAHQARSTKLTGDWAELIWRWLEGGEDPSALCQEYELFEGNFVRGIMKLGNILDEWLAIASLFGHTEQIEAVAGLRPTLGRDFVIQDSLYLHI